MEEIISTEALEREILEDARRKADRALRAAEEEASRMAAAGERRAAAAIAEFESAAARKAKLYRAEALGRLPLERSRILAAYVDSRLSQAVLAYLAGLPEEAVAGIARRLLLAGVPYLGSGGLRLRHRGIGAAAAASLLKDIAASRAAPGDGVATASVPGAAAVSYEAVEDPGLESPGAVAEAMDGSATMRATLDIVAEALLGFRRGELSSALCAAALDAATVLDAAIVLAAGTGEA
jgi:V/A-type H+-transporting ATPase subunit E